MAEGSEVAGHLLTQGPLERPDTLGLTEVQGGQGVDAGELARGVRVVVDAQVGEDPGRVVAGAGRVGEEGGTLPAAGVAALRRPPRG